jgi:hypothetical protein
MGIQIERAPTLRHELINHQFRLARDPINNMVARVRVTQKVAAEIRDYSFVHRVMVSRPIVGRV